MLNRRELILLAPAVLAGAEIPRPAADLTVRAATGEKFALNRYRGKVVALEFMLTWCQHCQKSARDLELVYKEFRPKGLIVLGVATNSTEQTAQGDISGFRATTGVTFPIGYVDKDAAVAFLQHPMAKIMYFPQIALVDRKGNIRLQEGGDPKTVLDAARLRGEIEKLIKESAPSAAPAKKS